MTAVKTSAAPIEPQENDQQENKDKKFDFVRRDLRQGRYSTNFGGKEIIIIDRQHYFTSDLAEISFLKADPEIVIFNPGTKKK